MSMEICVLCGEYIDTDYKNGYYDRHAAGYQFICMGCVEDIVNWYNEE